MKMNVKRMLLSMLSVAVVSASLGATTYAASNKYYTSVEIDSQKSVVGAERVYEEKTIGVDVANAKIGGKDTTSDNFVISVGKKDIFGFTATQSQLRTLSEGCTTVTYFFDESSKKDKRKRAVKFKANYSSLDSDYVTLYDCK
ncbi:MAG: hypothetical protein J6A58_12490 [Oscillospiraceae bacterium]|nr:hypothetical protein [Oscillospiraceae bacterium]